MRIALPATLSAEIFARRDPAAAIVALEGETMGTMWRVVFARPPHSASDAIRTAIAARLEMLVDEMSHWLPASDLSRFNRASAGAWSGLPPDFAHVMARGLAIAEATDGAFDPAIGHLVNLWGFGPPGPTPPPDDAAIEAARRSSGGHRLVFDAGMRRLLQPGGLALDLSGIAKGHAVDIIADLLHAAGIFHCLVEIGGELVGRGVRPDGDPWWVDLEVPPGTRVAPLRIALHGLAVATSGSYVRGGHTLDPRSGRPTMNGIVSASVLHRTALEADAWATALTVLGPEAAMARAAEHRIAARLVTHIDGEVREWLTPALVAMLDD